MKLLIILICSTLLSACINTAPYNGKKNGMLVLPMQATSPHKNAFSYRYIIHLDKRPGEIVITPDVSRDYIRVDNLKPGKYTMTGVSANGRRNYGAFAKNRFKPIVPINMEFSIEAGAITILENCFFVHSNIVFGNERADDSWGIAPIPSAQYEALYQELSNRGYLRRWVISDASSEIFASK